MTRAALLGLMALLAGCDRAAAPTPAATASPTPAAAPREPIRTTSGLTGQTSALTGAVSDFQVTVTDAATEVSLAADTLFAFDSATIESAAAPNLARTAALVAKGSDEAVQVVGHTDAKGDDAYNLALSRRRADAVAAWLRARPELAGRRIEVEGRGEAEPIAANAKPDGSDDPDGRARNRRVVVIIPK